MLTNASAAAYHALEAKRLLALAQRDAEQGVTPETQDYMSQAGNDLAFLREQLGVPDQPGLTEFIGDQESALQRGPELGIDAAELENLLAGVTTFQFATKTNYRNNIKSSPEDRYENFQAGISCTEERMEAVQVAANKGTAVKAPKGGKPTITVKAPKVKTHTVAGKEPKTAPVATSKKGSASNNGSNTKTMTLGQVRILQYLATLGKGAATTAAIVDAGCCGRNIFSGYVTSAAPAGSNSYMTTDSLLTQGYIDVIPSNGEVAKCFKITPSGRTALKEALKKA